MKHDEWLILFDLGNILLDSNSDKYSIFDARNDIADELRPKDKEEFMKIFEDKDFWTLSGLELFDCIDMHLKKSGCTCNVDDFKGVYLKHYKKVPWYPEMKMLIEDIVRDDRFHIGILSTACEMDYVLIRQNIPIHKLDYKFFSFNLGMKKPDDRIYKNIEVITGLNPRHILLIDDLQENICAAKSLGWSTLLATGKDFEKIRDSCYWFTNIDYKSEISRKEHWRQISEKVFTVKCMERSTGKIKEINPKIDDVFFDKFFQMCFKSGEYILLSGELPPKWQ